MYMGDINVISVLSYAHIKWGAEGRAKTKNIYNVGGVQ